MSKMYSKVYAISTPRAEVYNMNFKWLTHTGDVFVFFLLSCYMPVQIRGFNVRYPARLRTLYVSNGMSINPAIFQERAHEINAELFNLP